MKTATTRPEGYDMKKRSASRHAVPSIPPIDDVFPYIRSSAVFSTLLLRVQILRAADGWKLSEIIVKKV